VNNAIGECACDLQRFWAERITADVERDVIARRYPEADVANAEHLPSVVYGLSTQECADNAERVAQTAGEAGVHGVERGRPAADAQPEQQTTTVQLVQRGAFHRDKRGMPRSGEEDTQADLYARGGPADLDRER